MPDGTCWQPGVQLNERSKPASRPTRFESAGKNTTPLRKDVKRREATFTSCGGPPTRCQPRQAILDATLAVLADVGYGRLTIDAVATRAKASKPTIYRRWAGKRDLVVAAMEANADHAAPPVPDTGSFRGDLLARCQALADALSGFEGRLIRGLAEGTLEDPRLCYAIDRRTAAELPQNVIDRAVRRGELPPEAQPTVFVEVTLSVMIVRVMAGLPIRDASYLEHLVDDLVLPALRHVAPS